MSQGYRRRCCSSVSKYVGLDKAFSESTCINEKKKKTDRQYECHSVLLHFILDRNRFVDIKITRERNVGMRRNIG